MQGQIYVGELSRLEVPALERHFLALGEEDRRLRFGLALGDSAIRAYVAGIDFERDAVFGVFDDELALAAVAHLARDKGHAELGVSVLPGFRGGGLGAALLARSLTHARNWGMGTLFMHCLTENAAMLHLARKQGMEIAARSDEADAWLKLPPADVTSHFGEVFAQHVAVFDHALKSQRAAARRIAQALTPGTGSPGREK
jgi:GNAT superfamily N-acetyltransferase